uniref:Uncharacterized protein n=1 Tax=Rhizophora mucronata TaxID=61149 RepID=A0A2P2PCS9_RHIMU
MVFLGQAPVLLFLWKMWDYLD